MIESNGGSCLWWNILFRQQFAYFFLFLDFLRLKIIFFVKELSSDMQEECITELLAHQMRNN
jgi:hypothetical protein